MWKLPLQNNEHGSKLGRFSENIFENVYSFFFLAYIFDHFC